MDIIDFNHYFIEIKDIIDKRFLVFINPNTQKFFKIKNCYFAATHVKDDTIYLNMVNGKDKNNVEALRLFIKEMRQRKFRYIIFGTHSKNQKMLTVYKYIKATYRETIPNYYEDGDSYVEYVLDLETANRI